MDISVNAIPYVEGSEFHDAFPLTVKQPERLRERMEFIESLVQGKSVLHIGCLDHVPLIKHRMDNGRWLHSRLTEVASSCLGIDINREGIEFVRSELGISNIAYGDIESEDNKVDGILAQHWDYVVFGEVIEHADNPVSFLKKFISTYGNQVGKVIITAPNAFRASNIRHIFSGLEIINSDHRYWFTPYTIWKVVNQADMVVDTIQMCKFDYCNNKLRESVKDIVLRRYPLLAESLVVVCHQR